jgi:hypothetical protein
VNEDGFKTPMVRLKPDATAGFAQIQLVLRNHV